LCWFVGGVTQSERVLCAALPPRSAKSRVKAFVLRSFLKLPPQGFPLFLLRGHTTLSFSWIQGLLRSCIEAHLLARDVFFPFFR